MFETLESIREQILAGEDSFAEFKELRHGCFFLMTGWS